jgi:hypothetical protein
MGGERRPSGWSAAQPGGGAPCARRGGLPAAPAESRAEAALRARLGAAAPFIGAARHVWNRTARGRARTALVRRRRQSTPRCTLPGGSRRGNLGACGFVSRASLGKVRCSGERGLGQCIRPRNAGRHRTPRQQGAARRGAYSFSLGHFEHDFLPEIE